MRNTPRPHGGLIAYEPDEETYRGIPGILRGFESNRRHNDIDGNLQRILDLATG